MDEFLSKILKALKILNIKPVIYGSFGVANYLGDYKKFEDIDILIDDEFLNIKWEKFNEVLESNNFSLIDKKEHEFELDDKKVGFASKDILLRDKIISNYSELIQYKNTDALTLTTGDFLKAYEFSVKDGYRINARGKKDEDIVNRLKTYLNG
jgi:hypothetical protein